MVIAQGEVWWADLGEPAGSEPGFRQPVVVVQGEAFNASTLRTVVCVALTSNLKWAEAPGNVLLPARATGLSKPSVANVSQVVTLDRDALTERAGRPLRRASSSFWLASTWCSAEVDLRVSGAADEAGFAGPTHLAPTSLAHFPSVRSFGAAARDIAQISQACAPPGLA
jgi:mRNA interferase MazF